jgi:hypothetical protein
MWSVPLIFRKRCWLQLRHGSGIWRRYEQVKHAVSTLSDAELAQLATRADKAQADFAAGTLSDRDLIIILVAIAALILIIVAVR